MLHKLKKPKPVYNPTRSVWWRSQNRALMLRSRAVILTRASQNFMASRSGITRLVYCYLVPVFSGLALLLIISSLFILPWQNDSVYAIDANETNDASGDNPDAGIATIADSPSASLSIGSNSIANSGHINGDDSNAIISMTNDITVNAKLINSYNLQIVSGTTSTTLEGPTTINTINNTTNPSGISTAEGLANNTWGYSWNNGSYKGITTSNTTIANDSINSDGSVEYTRPLTFAAKFDKDANAGHYKTKVNLLLTATPKILTTYTLSYDANGGSGAPIQQSVSNYETSHTFTISSAKPTRTGHIFQGWSTSSNSTTVSYQPGAIITLYNTTPVQTLYAVWEALGVWKYNNGSTVNSGITTMQDMTTGICSQVSTPAKNASNDVVPVILLQDSRDDNIYTVRKLQDGKCWMTQNLRLSGGRTLTPSDSNVGSNWYFPTSLNDSNLGEINQYGTKIHFTAVSSDGGSGYYTAESYITTPNSESGETGYYSFTAATAGTATASITSVNTLPYSICPKGWKLPSGTQWGSDTEQLTTAADIYTNYSTTDTALRAEGVAKIQNEPYNFTATGKIASGSLRDGSLYGFWWTSTVESESLANHMGVTQDVVYTGSYITSRYDGNAIRCIAK